MKITTSTGTWIVRRRWAPRHLDADSIWTRFRRRTRSVRKRGQDLSDIPDPGCDVDLAEGLIVFVAIVLFVLFMIFFGIPFLIALGELLLIALLAIAGLIGRVVFRRPWTLEAIDPAGTRHSWSVVGWRASGAGRRVIAERVAATGHVPTDQEVAMGLGGT